MPTPYAIAATQLNQSDIDQYWTDGFLFPVDTFRPDAIADYRTEFEQMESTWRTRDLAQPLNTYKRVNAHLVMPMVDQIARSSELLDVVERLLGPNILLYSGEFFVKEPNTKHIVSMHQDLTYWGFGAIDGLVTVWVPLSPATKASGCMDFVRGSHKNAILEHTDTFDKNNLLSRGQEVQVAVSDADKTAIELQPGQISLHHGLTIHGSGPNTSDDRRIACVLRFMRPDMAQVGPERDYATLVRGTDMHHNFIHTPAPTDYFTADALALYETIRKAQAKILMAGTETKTGMYA